MKKALAVLLSVLLFTSMMLAQAKPAAKTPAPAAAAQSATGFPDKAMLKTVLDAWATMNLDNVSKYYDQDPKDVFYDVAPVKYTGWKEYVAGFEQAAAAMKSIQFTLNDDAVVHHMGNWAWGTATVRAVMTDKSDKATSLDCRWTTVWEKKGAKWVIVHDHFSAPLPL